MEILVMDEDGTLCKGLEAVLQQLGHAVVTAMDGEKAIKAFRVAKEAGAPFHLAILDATVASGMGANEVREQLKEINPNAKLVVCSAENQLPEIQRPKEYGFDAALDKGKIGIESVEQLLRRLQS